MPSGVRQLVGAACGTARRPAVAGSARGIFLIPRSMLPGQALFQSGASGCCAPWSFMLVLALPGRTHAGNALAPHSGSLKRRGGSLKGNQAEVWSAFRHPLPPFTARSPQGDWGPVSGASSSSSSGLQRFPTPDPGI